MSRHKLISCLLACVFLWGCDRTEDPGHSRDPELFSLDIKRLVLNQVEEAKVSKEPGDEISPILSELDNLESRPVGDHLAIYQQLKEKATALHGKCMAVEGRPNDLTKGLEEIVQLANQLPGEVTVDRRDDR